MGNSLCLYGCVLYHREKTGDSFGYAQGRLEARKTDKGKNKGKYRDLSTPPPDEAARLRSR
jgi:hypothetical protein